MRRGTSARKTAKLDLYREHKEEYVAPKTPVLVEAGPAQYLAVSGKGAPGGECFQSRVTALYAVAFTVKMTHKSAGKGDYKVCTLEGLWWDEMDRGDFSAVPLDQWCWKLLIRTPDFVTEDDLRKARDALRQKKKPPEFEEVTLETMEEGLCVQVLHVGPYSAEGKTVRAMHRFAEGEGLSFHGVHHEIYLSDPRRVAPEKLRTILRHPVRRA